MAPSINPDALSREALLAMLRWQRDAGVDEAVGQAPWNRFEAPARAPQAAAPRGASPRAARPRATETPGKASPAPSPASNIDFRAIDSLDALREAIGQIDGGAPQRFATNTVFGDGAAGAKVMFVGEAPGAEEDRQGVPFVGPSGKLLDRMLAAIGLARGDVYIANTLYWRPPGNRTPTPEERLACQPALMRQIELVGPKLIAPLGGPAAQTLLSQTTGITRLRGRWFDFNTRPDAGDGLALPAMPTFHPAFLLRQPAQKKQVWQDLRAIRAKLAEG